MGGDSCGVVTLKERCVAVTVRSCDEPSELLWAAGRFNFLVLKQPIYPAAIGRGIRSATTTEKVSLLSKIVCDCNMLCVASVTAR